MNATGQLLDEEIRTAIRMGGKTLDDLASLTPAQARALQTKMARAFRSAELPAVAREDLALPGPAGWLASRLYRPRVAHGPLILFIHGGGWVGGDLDTHDQMCRMLASGTDCTVIAVTYRLAPEHPFPAAVEDCVHAARWVLLSAASLDCDPSRVAIFGESAGANLAAAAVLSLANEPLPRFAFQCLAYPATDLRLNNANPDEPLDPLGLSWEEALWCRTQYVHDDKDLVDWRASPILAPNLDAAPPTHVLIAGVDPLRADGEAYARALAAAGVPTTWRRYDGLPHGFLSLPVEIPRVAAAYAQLYQRLRTGLRIEPATSET